MIISIMLILIINMLNLPNYDINLYNQSNNNIVKYNNVEEEYLSSTYPNQLLVRSQFLFTVMYVIYETILEGEDISLKDIKS